MSGSTRIGALRADLDLETAAWEGSLRTARTSMSRAQQQIERSLTAMQAQAQRTSAAFDTLGAAAGALRTAFAPLAAVLSIGGLVGMTRSALNAAGGLGELAEQAGVSVEGLQILRFAAAQAGVSNEQLTAGLQRLTRTLGEAGEGGQSAIEAFQRLGVSFRDSQGRLRTSEQVLPEIAEALSRIPDPATRAAAAVALFGRGGQALLPILSQGADGLRRAEQQARSFGAVLSEALSAQADTTGDQIAVLNRQIEVLQQRFAAGLAPTILRGVELLQEGLRGLNALLDNPSLRNLLLGGAAGGTVAGGAVAGGVLGARVGALAGPLGAAIGGTAGAIGGAAAGVLGGAGILQQTTTALQDAEASLATLQRRLDDLRARGPAFQGDAASTANWQQAVARLEQQVATARAEVERLSAEGQGATQVFDGLARAAEKVAQAVKGTSDTLSGAVGLAAQPRNSRGSQVGNVATGARIEPQLRQYIRQLEQATRAAQLELETVGQSNIEREVARALLEAETRARADQAARLRASAELTAAERSQIEAAARARATAIEQERTLTQLRREGARVTELVATAQERLAAEMANLDRLLAAGAITQETYARATERLQDELSGAADVAFQLEKALGAAFADAIAEGKSFGEVLRNLERDLLRIGTQLAFRGLVNGLFGDSGGGGAGLFSGIARLITSAFGGFRAAGGPVDPSRYYVVGERGPEIFRPATAGVIEPELPSGRGGMVFHFHGVRDMDGFRQSQAAVAAVVARGVRAGARNL